MRSIHADLSAAQKATNRVPYLYAVVKDRLAGINRLRRTQWYAGAEADKGHAAIVAGDGSLIRARFDGLTLYRSRVTTPGSGSTYSSWTGWTIARADLVAFAKLSADGATIACLIVHPGFPDEVWRAITTDHGASWSVFALAFINSGEITKLAAAGKTDGHMVVIVNNGAGVTQARAWRWDTSSWTDHGLATPPTALTAQGYALYYSSDWNVISTGADADGVQYVRTLVFGDGYSAAANTWSAYKTDIVSAISSANIAYAAPFAARPDINRVTFRQQYTGTVAYDRCAHTQQPDFGFHIDDVWREPVPIAIAAAYGIAISHDATNVFYTTARYVYHSPAVADSLDITADIVSARLHDDPLNPILSHIDLNNASGKYATPGAGAVAALTKGADVDISPGYITTSGAKASAYGPTYHIEAFEHTYEKGRAVLRLVLGSPWTHLARHRFPRAVTFDETNKNISQQLRYITARVGYELSSTGGSSDSANLYPPLAIQPGTSALAAFRAVLQRITDHIYTYSIYLIINEPLAADAADADYKRPLSDGDQRISSATYRDALKDANHIQIFADDDAEIIAEDLDDAEAQLLYSAPRQRADTFLDTGAEATARAAREQREQTIYSTLSGQLIAPVHCGLQTNDVIAITDPRAGLTDAKRRVLSLQLRYDRGPRKARYDHVIELGAP